LELAAQAQPIQVLAVVAVDMTIHLALTAATAVQVYLLFAI
jgi:hypothetical protein